MTRYIKIGKIVLFSETFVVDWALRTNDLPTWVGLGRSLNPERRGLSKPPVGSRGRAEEVLVNSEQNNQTQQSKITKLRMHLNGVFIVC